MIASDATEEPDLPEPTPIGATGAQTISASTSADWVLVAFDRAWVTDVRGSVASYDITSGRPLDTVEVRQVPCASMDDGFGAVWTATCDDRGVARIDPSTGRVTGWVSADVAADGESSIGAGEGAVWAITDGKGCIGCRLVRIDPERVEIEAAFDVQAGGSAVRAGLGGVWITYRRKDQVVHVDPDDGDVVAAIDVGGGPLFLDVGAGGVWVMDQVDGSVSHIDPATDEVVATIPVDRGIQGGDIRVGDGFVWLRASSVLVAQIDPPTDRVVAMIGSAQGSGSADAGNGQLWISAHDVGQIYRVPLAA